MDFGNLTPIDIQRYLGGIDYPASLEDILSYAKSKGAGEEVLGLMKQLPSKDYTSPADVSQAVGGLIKKM